MKYEYKPFNSVIIPTGTNEKVELEAAINTIKRLVSKANNWSGGTNNAYEYCGNSGIPTYVAESTVMNVVYLLTYWLKVGVKFNNDYDAEQEIVNELFDINEMFGCELNDKIIEKSIKDRKVDLDLEYLSDFNKRMNIINSFTIETHEETNDEWEEIV